MKKDFINAARKLANDVDSIDFRDLGITVYNPLKYAWQQNQNYIDKYLNDSMRYVFLGMNPGPFGMAQTGVPFGDVVLVRDWLEISGKVGAPAITHPKRPIQGFDCSKREVSGSRLWGWAKNRYGMPSNFFRDYFVWNYCPLVFMEESGANKTPDKLPPEYRERLFKYCDEALLSLVKCSKATHVIGVGKFARKRAEICLGSLVNIGDILHPSPASPKANKNWANEIEAQLGNMGCLI